MRVCKGGFSLVTPSPPPSTPPTMEEFFAMMWLIGALAVRFPRACARVVCEREPELCTFSLTPVVAHLPFRQQ